MLAPALLPFCGVGGDAGATGFEGCLLACELLLDCEFEVVVVLVGVVVAAVVAISKPGITGSPAATTSVGFSFYTIDRLLSTCV